MNRGVPSSLTDAEAASLDKYNVKLMEKLGAGSADDASRLVGAETDDVLTKIANEATDETALENALKNGTEIDSDWIAQSKSSKPLDWDEAINANTPLVDDAESTVLADDALSAYTEGVGDVGKLDWDSVVSKKGETRLDHINRHSTPNSSRATHGVFNGDPQNIVNQAWNNRGRVDPIKDGMGGEIYNIPMKNAGYESGYNNTGVAMDYVTIIVKEGTSEVIAAFPSCGKYGY